MQAHTCQEAANQIVQLSDEVKKAIEKYIAMNMTRKRIIQQIRIDLPNEPADKKQIVSYYKKYRKELFGKANTSVEDMVNFCAQNDQIPDDPDVAFVLAYDHSPIIAEGDASDDIEDILLQRAFDAVDEELDDDEEQLEQPWIRYIVSTKRFLTNSAKSKNICADGTKKVIVQKYPLLVFGATDMDSTQRFHLLAVMVSKYERASDFEFGFKAIQNGIQRVHNEQFEPKILMRDAAFAIHNGFVSVFGDDTISLMCYAHVIRAVDRRPVETGADKEAIKKDIGRLRLSYDKKTFDTGCQLFLDKWEKFAPMFTQYFDQTWIKQNCNWYNGACIRMVKTNNCIENWNGNLKRYHTHWKITGLNQFKIDLMGIVSKESKEYEKDKALFKSDVTISNNMRKEGWSFSKTKSIIRRKGDDGNGYCYLRKGDSTTALSDSDVDTFLYTVHTV